MHQNHTPERIWTKSFISLSLTQFILFTIFYSLLTTLPIYVIENMGEAESNAGLVVTFMLAAAIIIRPFSAKILDVFGKRASLIVSAAIFTLTTFGYLWTDTFTPLLVLRFIHGISFGVLTTATGAIAADIVPIARRGAGMGYFAMAMNLAVVAGPFIGLTLLQFISFDTFFLVLGILMIIGFIFTLLVELNEPKTTSKKGLSLKLTDLVEPKALPIAVISGLVGAAYASVLSFVPVFAEENGLEATANYFFLIYAVVMVASRPSLGRLFDEKGAKIVLVPSLVVFAIGLFVLGLTSTGIALLIAGAILGLGYGSLLPGFQTLAVQMTTHKRSGHAMSTFFIFYDLGIALGASIWGMVIATAGFSSMYFISAILVIATTVILYMLLTRQNKQQEEKQTR